MNKLIIFTAALGLAAGACFALDDETTAKDIAIETEDGLLIVFAEKEGKGAREGNILGGKIARVGAFVDFLPNQSNGPLDIDF